jgi:hypothetical protein
VSGPSVITETKYGVTTLLSTKDNTPLVTSFELKTYSDNTTDYDTGTITHIDINFNEVPITYYIVGGVTYYLYWYDVRSGTNYREKYYTSDSGGVRVVVSETDKLGVTQSNVPSAYWNLFNA